jgi:hypothetical protein
VVTGNGSETRPHIATGLWPLLGNYFRVRPRTSHGAIATENVCRYTRLILSEAKNLSSATQVPFFDRLMSVADVRSLPPYGMITFCSFACGDAL